MGVGGVVISSLLVFWFFFIYFFSRFSAPEPNANLALSVVINFSHFRLLLWNGIQRILTGSKMSTSSTKLVLIGSFEKTRLPPGLWLTATFSTSPLKPLNGIQRNLKGSKISTSSTNFVAFGPIGKTRWPPWPLIDWDIFDFSYVTANWNSTKLERKQDLNVLHQGGVFRADWKNKMEFNKIHRKQDLNVFYHVCVFQADRRNKIVTPASDWLRHFRFLFPLKPLNGIQQNLTGRKISKSSNKFMFFGSIGGTRWPPGLWFAETFSTFPPWPLNKIQRNLTGSKISMSSTNFVLFGPMKKGSPGLWLAEAFSTFPLWPLNKIQRNLTASKISMSSTNFVLFGPMKKGSPGLWLAETFSTFTLWPLNRIQRNLTGSKISKSSTKFVLFDETWQEARYQRPLQSLCFWADRKNKMAAPDSDWLRHFRLLLWTEFNKTWQEIRYVNAIFQVCVFRADRKNIVLRFTICGPWCSYFCIK